MPRSKRGPALSELNAQIASLQAQAETLRKKEVAEVITKMKAAITHYGLTAADLGLGEAARRTRRPSSAAGGKLTARGRQTASSRRPARPAKFKDDQGNTWSGIGKRPQWFKAALAAGKKPEELLAKGWGSMPAASRPQA